MTFSSAARHLNLYALALAVCLLWFVMPCSARGDPVTLYTASSFAGEDESASVYTDLLHAFESEENCVIIDHSSASSEAWKQEILNDFAAGNEPDILFFFACSADSQPLLSRVVPVEELNRADPALNLPVNEALREPDGKVYAIPVRPFWEGLLCNTELFDSLDLPLPDTWEHLMEAVRGFRAHGITPFTLSLMDAPHYIAEMVMLACCTPEEQQARPSVLEEIPASWFRAMALLRELAESGAFPDQASLLTERSANALFREGKAAMQVDGVWYAKQLSEAEMGRTAVLPVPRATDDHQPVSFIGGVSMGFYLTRRAYEQPVIREKALRLLAYLTSEESRSRLSGSTLTGLLASSASDLLDAHLMLSPVQDDMNASAREVWLMECIPAVAEGRMTPEECWQKVMAFKPFD